MYVDACIQRTEGQSGNFFVKKTEAAPEIIRGLAETQHSFTFIPFETFWGETSCDREPISWKSEGKRRFTNPNKQLYRIIDGQSVNGWTIIESVSSSCFWTQSETKLIVKRCRNWIYKYFIDYSSKLILNVLLELICFPGIFQYNFVSFRTTCCKLHAAHVASY